MSLDGKSEFESREAGRLGPVDPASQASIQYPAGEYPAGEYLTCEICGQRMSERHCKIVCPNCGYTRDCSDP